MNNLHVFHVMFWVLAGFSFGVGIAALRTDDLVVNAIGFLVLIPATMAMWGVLDTWTTMVERQ